MNAHDALLAIDVSPFESEPLLGTKPRAAGEDRDRPMARRQFGRDELEFGPREDLHLALPRRRVRNKRCRILVEVLAPDGVPNHLAQRAVNIVRRAGRKFLAPRTDCRGSDAVDAKRPERSDRVLQAVAKRFDGDLGGDGALLEVLVDERCERRRVVAPVLSQ